MAYSIAIWDWTPDTWSLISKGFDPEISDIGISKVNVFDGRDKSITIRASVSYEDFEAEDIIGYKIFINDEEIINETGFSFPFDINKDISTEHFALEENALKIIVYHGDDEAEVFDYTITKEDRDTFIFNREFKIKEDYISISNTEVEYGEGLKLQQDLKEAEVVISLPTDGKNKINSITMDALPDDEVLSEDDIISKMSILEDTEEYTIFEQELVSDYDIKALDIDEDDDGNAILKQTVEIKQTMMFAISSDGKNYKVFKNGSWSNINRGRIYADGMTISEITSLVKSDYTAFAEEMYQGKLEVVMYMFDNSLKPKEPIIKSFVLEYAENEKPVIIEGKITPDDIHNEYTIVEVDAKDFEGDNISYKVSIKKPGKDYEQVHPTSGWYETNANTASVYASFNYPYFLPGDNEVKVTFKDQRGEELNWIGHLLLSNIDPKVVIVYDDTKMTATIGDDDGDDITYRLFINNKMVFDYGPLTKSPVTFEQMFDSDNVNVGAINTIKLEVKDSHGGTSSEQFTIVGSYRGLLFKNENGRYLIDDKGYFLEDLLFEDPIIGGQTSPTKKVILENKTGYAIQNIIVKAEKANFAQGATLELSEVEMPFTPRSNIAISNTMSNLDTTEVFVRITTDRTANQSSNFFIDAEAEIIE